MKKVIYSIIFLLLIFVVSASDFSVDVNPIKNVIFKGEIAEFSLNITNNAEKEDTFFIKTSDLNWLIDDSSVTSLTLDGKKSKLAKVAFKPLSDVGFGNYGIILKVQGSTSDTEKVLSTTIIDPNKLVSFKFLNLEGIDPRREAIAKLQVKNNYDLPITVKYLYTSDLFNGGKDIILARTEYKTDEFAVTLDPSTQEGDYEFKFQVYFNDKLVEETKTVLIIKKYEGAREIITPESSVLLNKVYVKKINDGNSLVIDSYTKEFSLLERLFTKSIPEPDSIIRKDDVYVYKWDINLNPKESKEISIVTDYRTPLVILILLIIFAYIAYSKMRRYVDIQKKVLTIKADGSFNKIKVLLTIKNKTGKTIKNVKVMESIPGSIKTIGDYSVTPNKNVRENNANHLIWIINHMGPGEERVLAYKIESKVTKINLPRAIVRYNLNEKALMSGSNSISISA